MTNEELEKLASEVEAMKEDILTLIIPDPKCKSWAVASLEDAAALIRSKMIKPRIKRTVWLHVFRNGEVVSTPEPPDHYITTRFACVKVEIDCAEGEGL